MTYFATMKRSDKKYLVLFTLFPFSLLAQNNFVSNPSYNPNPAAVVSGLKNTQEMTSLQNNFTTFRTKSQEITPELLELTPEAYQSNPDFGILPDNTPCNNCVELIHKRTLSSRYYIKKGSNGTEFYVQQCNGNFNYQDSDGMIREVDPNLTPSSVPGVYSALNQPEPKTVNLTDGTSMIRFPGLDLTFNKNTKLLYLENGVETLLQGTMNLNASTIGSSGAYSQHVWSGIDREVISDQFGIETNFIFHSLPVLPGSSGWLAIGDEIELPAGYTIVRDSLSGVSTATTPENYWLGPLSIRDASGVEKARWEAIYIYDNNTERGAGITQGAYEVFEPIPGKFVIRALVKASWMADPERIFPITFDPTVTSAAATFPTQIGFSIYAAGNGFCGSSSAFCLGGPLNVTFPGGATATSSTWSLNYRAFNPAWQSDGGFRMVGPCGEDPANTDNWYSCATNAAGICSGTGFVAPQLVSGCITPSCAATTIPFRVKNIDCFGWANGCNATYLRTIANTWTVTVQGNTLETLGNNATGNGSQIIAPPTCSGNTTLNPAALYGVPGYTYSWSTGATTSTITIPSASGSNFTVTVTDACGVARVATFTITCPLGAEYAYFKTEKMDRDVLVSWKTLFETNMDHFWVERSLDAENFMPIASVTAVGTGSNNYSVTDKNVLPGTVFYRIISVDKNGSEEYSQILSVSENEVTGLAIIPNPTIGYFNAVVEVPFTAVYDLEIFDESGKSVVKKELSLEKGLMQIPFHLVNESGVYTLIIKEGKYRETARFVLKN